MNDTSHEAQENTGKSDQAVNGTAQPSGQVGDQSGQPVNTADNGAKPSDSPTIAAEQPEGKIEEKAGETKGGASLEVQLTEAQAKANEYLDGWQRARAEFANYKKRAEKERDEIYQNAAVETLRKLLPIIDDFDRAVANVPADKADDEVIKGFSLIHRKMLTLLDSTGVKVINPVGEVFDPAFHEAIGRDESSDLESGRVTAVLQKGYVYGDKVLRPALVRVAS
jgi:molecular chaperone GrpE